MIAQTAPPTEATRPYTATEAAERLGASHDTIQRHFRSLGGYRLGRRYRFPRWRIDRMVAAPAEDTAPPAVAEPSPLERVLTLLPLMDYDDRRQVALAALAAGTGR